VNKVVYIYIYTSTVIGTLAVDGWAVTFSTAKRGLGRLRSTAPPRPLLAVPNVTAHPLTASVPTSYHSMHHAAIYLPLQSEGLINQQSVAVAVPESQRNTSVIIF